MKNMICKNQFLYSSWDTFSNVIRRKVGLYKDIEFDVLNEAVQEAAVRYPYFCRKIVKIVDEYDVVFNEAAVPVCKGDTPLILGSREANGHFMAVSCAGNEIIFDIYHSMTDGKGLMEWVKTVLYLYLKKTEDVNLPSDDIRIPGEDFLPGETDDPYDKLDLDSVTEPLSVVKSSGSFIPDRRYAKGEARRNYLLKASEKDVMKLSSSQDGSPAIVLSYFVKEMLRTLFPDMDKPVVCGIPHSIRNLTCGENNYHDQVVENCIIYDERMNAFPREKQFTVARGKMIVQSEPENVLYTIRQRAEFALSVDDIPNPSDRRQAYKDNARLIIENPESMAISYEGRIRWGAIEKYIKYMTINVSALSAPVLVNTVPVNGWFYISMLLDHTSDDYVRTLVKLLNDNDIEAEYLFDYPNDHCKVEFPY